MSCPGKKSGRSYNICISPEKEVAFRAAKFISAVDRCYNEIVMAVDLICPDCGGIIGGVGRDSEGRGPCTCVNHDDPPRANGSDTVSIPSLKGGYDAADGREKLCIVCGKNVAGHRRVKDS